MPLLSPLLALCWGTSRVTHLYKKNIDENLEETIIFSEYLKTKYTEKDDDYEDLMIFIVDKNISKEKANILKQRALRLYHQDDINDILKNLCDIRGNIRSVGFPKSSKEMDYDKKQAKIQARGFYGKIAKKENDKYRYKFEEPSWKESEFNGFSGSPILEILPVYNPDTNELKVQSIPIGILLSATKSKGEFISINVATNLIAQYLKEKGINVPIIKA